MSLHGTQNRVGANVLKRLIGNETSLGADFENRSALFPGHEQRIRYHAHRVKIGQREEDKRLAAIRKERKKRARKAKRERLARQKQEDARLALLAKENES